MPEEETITFEYIRKIQREEQHEPKLSKLPEDFYDKAKEYLEQKRELLKKKGDRGISIEINNIERLLENIYNRRETKIINHAIITSRTGIPPQNLTKQEQKFFNQIVDLLKFHKEKTLNILLEKTKEEKGFETLKFIKDVPEFVGADMKKYGPFKKGIIADIPKENAKLLIQAELAEKHE